MFATQILPETLSNNLEEESHTVVGFIVINDEKHEIKKGETKIGRDSSMCSITIESFTVSKVHAVIESDGIDETFIYDVGSTNQTRLGKKVLKPHCRYKLDNDSNITLGNIIIKFILPPDKDSNVILDKTTKENCTALDEYEDIFEVATQPFVPQSNAQSSRVAAFKTHSKNFQTFKIPNTKTNASPELPDSVFDLQTQCGLNLQETVSKTQNHNSLHDNSEIFNLPTQCQIHKSQIVRENKCKDNSVQEVDEFNLFLNDGQDDVLCAVGSLHSPKEKGNDDVEKKIKTEIENLSQLLNAPTQVQPNVTECQEEKGTEVNGSLQDKDFSTISSYLPISAGTTLNSRLKVNNANNSCAQLIEDVIKTQEVTISESQEKCQPDNLSQDKETLAYLGGILTDKSMMEQKTQKEDFILTQSFEVPLNKESAIVIPETQDFSEDFIQTQIYDVESEKKAVEQTTTKIRSTQLYDATADFTQQDKDDCVATHVFKEPEEAKGTSGNNEKNVISDDEDFIVTQAFKEPVEPMRTNGNHEKNVINDDEDFIATQTFKEPVKTMRTDGNNEKNVISDDEDFIATQTFKETMETLRTDGNHEKDVINDEDFIATQAFKEPVEAMRTSGNCEKNVISDDEDFIATQAFKEPVEAMRTSGNCEKNVISDDEDFIATQTFKEPVEPMRTDGNHEKNVISDDEDFIATQTFKEPVEAMRTSGNCEKNVDSDEEDFIATQVVEPLKKGVINSEDSRVEKSSRESSPDLLALGGPYKDSEDCIATQIFQPVECQQNSKTTYSVLSEEFVSVFFSNVKKDDSSALSITTCETAESSGDETESDLEILLEKHKTARKDDKIKENCQEIKSEAFQIQKRASNSPSRDSNDVPVFKLQPGNAKEMQSKRKQIPDSSDSDATDCEEMAVLNPEIRVKHEPAEPIDFEETQVLTLTPPNNFIGKTCDSLLTDGESPKFEIRNDNRPLSALSLEMPSTQDMETSVKRRNEITLPEKYEDFPRFSPKLQTIEVGIESSRGSTSFWTSEPSEKKVHSPKKRPRSCNDAQVVPVKKSKTEDKPPKSRENEFSKLVRTHDIAQIQPSRTRNSMKNLTAEVRTDFPEEGNTNTVRPTSRRTIRPKRGSTKVVNCDITPYLIKKGRRSSRRGQTKETAVREDKGPKTVAKVESSTRVLRSSVRNSNSPSNLPKPPERRVSTRSGKRSFRTKKSECFESPRFSVAFTGFDCPSFDKIISDLEGNKVNDVPRCDVVVADKVRRTVKFLCAIGLSLPITSPQWLVESNKEKQFLNPWDFILKDEEAENKWDFELRTSLERSKRGKLLQGFNIFATKNTKPPVKDLLAIVECCGGTPIFQPPEVWPKKTIIVSCVEDKKFWPAAKLRNVQVVHYEFILSGVLRQKIDFKTHRLR